MRLDQFFIFLCLVSCDSRPNSQTELPQIKADTFIPRNSKTNDMAYKEQLEATKKHYPFGNWREGFNDGLEQYTEENCNKAQAIFDKLIAELISIGQDAKESDKVELFKTAVFALNELNDQVDDLIETGEREDLCELIDQITIAAGMNPKNYAGGEGIADQWRHW